MHLCGYLSQISGILGKRFPAQEERASIINRGLSGCDLSGRRGRRIFFMTT